MSLKIKQNKTTTKKKRKKKEKKKKKKKKKMIESMIMSSKSQIRISYSHVDCSSEVRIESVCRRSSSSEAHYGGAEKTKGKSAP